MTKLECQCFRDEVECERFRDEVECEHFRDEVLTCPPFLANGAVLESCRVLSLAGEAKGARRA